MSSEPTTERQPIAGDDERLLVLAEATEALHAGLDPEFVVPAVLALSRRLISADAYAVWRADPATGEWRVIAEFNLSAEYSRSTTATSDALPQQPVVVEDVMTDPWLKSRHAAYRAEGIRSMLCVPLRIRGVISGTITFYFHQPHARVETEVKLASALASLAGTALTTAELYQEQSRMRADAEMAHARLSFLAEASGLLASSLEHETTLEHFAQLAVPRIADWCTIHLVDDNGKVQRVAVAHADPAKVRWAHELEEKYPYDPDQPRGIPSVLRSGVSELYAEITDEMLRGAARDPYHLEMLRLVGFHSVMIVPLRARGRTLGTITFINAESGVRFGDADVRLGEELASRASLAIDNARLYQGSRRALEAQLRSEDERISSEAQFRQLVEQSPLSVQILSPAGRTLEVNRAWEDLWGTTLEKLGDYNVLLDSQLERLGVTPYIRRAFLGESVAIPPVLYDRRRVLPDLPPDEMGERWVRAFAYPVRDGAGRIRKIVLLHEDWSQRKRLEDQLRDRIAELGEADRQKDQFLAMLAHELRNPLAPIRNAAHVMKLAGSGDTEQQWAREVIERQTQHLTRLVDDLLDVSRITQGMVTLQREPVDLSTIVDRALETSRPLIEARKHRLEIARPGEALCVEGDMTRLVQVVGNLLNNAAKYTDEGGNLRVELAREGDLAIIRVMDDGIGLAPDLASHVFDLFIQANRSLDRSQGGLGIGLTLVRKLVELHGGNVEARSAGPGLGSEFIVRLPAVAETAAALRKTPVLQPAAPAVAALRILVVEDNADSAETVRFLLQLEGHVVRTALDAPAAFEALRTFHPRVILCDIGLPGMNGYELCERLRGQSEHEHTTMIALSGYGQEEDRRRSRAAGFDHHLTKPFEPDALSAILSALPPREASA